MFAERIVMNRCVQSIRGNALHRIFAVLIASAALAGCAGLPTGMEPPAVTISDFGVGTASLFEQQFNLKLRIQNPNPDELRIDGVAFQLEINDQLFAMGVGNQGVTVPRFSSGFMQVEAVSSLGSVIRQFGVLTKGDKPGFRYRIKGSLSVAGGTRIPFDQRGEFDLSALAPK